MDRVVLVAPGVLFFSCRVKKGRTLAFPQLGFEFVRRRSVISF